MKINKKYDFSHENVNFGFEYLPTKPCKTTINDIVNSVKQNIVIYDYNNRVLSEITSTATNLLNDSNIIFVALTNIRELKEINNNGVKSGFFRSTKEESDYAIIIVDKKSIFLALSSTLIFKCDQSIIDETFNYINYIIWNKSYYEMLQGTMTEVKEIRHSVVKPTFSKLITKNNLLENKLIAGTVDFNLTNGIKYILNETFLKNSILLNKRISSLAKTKDKTYINIFSNMYAEIDYDDCIELGKSFSNTSLNKLIGKEVWIEGNKFLVKDNKIINKSIILPIDQYTEYKPDFDLYLSDLNKFQYLYVEVIVFVSVIQIDSTFKKDKRYSDREKLINRINSETDRLLIIFDDEKETLDNIINETRLIEKIKVFNNFIDNHEIGLKPLKTNNKKNSIKKISINISDLVLPPKNIGELFEKNNDMYFAINDIKQINAAKVFLKKNNLRAILVLR